MPASSGLPSFVLLIERGITRFPERPLDVDRFLIGAGSNCHLQLGGNMPLLHSIIVPESEHLWIDSFVSTPPLLVNGRRVRESELHVGDLIEIDGFAFCVGVREPADTQPLAADRATNTGEVEQIVDQISDELKNVEPQFTREAGAAALLQAAKLADDAAVSQDAPATPRQQSTAAEVLRELQELAAKLQKQEESLRERAHQLALTHEQLEKQLALICEQMQQSQQEPGTSKLRLTA